MKLKSTLIALALLPVVAYAASGTTPEAPSTVSASQQTAGSPTDELASLQSQIPIWKAKAEIAKYRADIRNADTAQQGGTSSLNAPLPPAQLPTALPAPARAAAPASEAIRVVSIRGYKGQYAASLDVDGTVVSAQAGDVIDGNWTVTSVSDTQVLLSKKGLTRVVRF
jgi:type IV pilus biogenesis protein PilP